MTKQISSCWACKAKTLQSSLPEQDTLDVATKGKGFSSSSLRELVIVLKILFN